MIVLGYFGCYNAFFRAHKQTWLSFQDAQVNNSRGLPVSSLSLFQIKEFSCCVPGLSSLTDSWEQKSEKQQQTSEQYQHLAGVVARINFLIFLFLDWKEIFCCKNF